MAVPELNFTLIFTLIYVYITSLVTHYCTDFLWHRQPYIVGLHLVHRQGFSSISTSCMLLTKRVFSLTSGIAYWRSYTSAFELSPVGNDTDFHTGIKPSRHAWYTQIIRLSISTTCCSQIISKCLLLLLRLIAEELMWRCQQLCRKNCALNRIKCTRKVKDAVHDAHEPCQMI